jgi:hypothetical protein
LEKRKPPAALPLLRQAQRFSVPELAGETLVADRVTDDDVGRLKTLLDHKQEIASDPHAASLTPGEGADWERILGKAAGDEQLFEKKRRDAQARTQLAELADARKLAGLPRQRVLAEPGAVQLPRFVFRWLVSDEAREEGAWSLMDVGLLVAVSGAFANDDASVFVDGRFDGDGDSRTLVAPGGVGADLRMFGRVAGSPIEDGSGHVRVREALRVLAANRWVELDVSVSELRIRLGERARRLSEPTEN